MDQYITISYILLTILIILLISFMIMKYRRSTYVLRIKSTINRYFSSKSMNIQFKSTLSQQSDRVHQLQQFSHLNVSDCNNMKSSQNMSQEMFEQTQITQSNSNKQTTLDMSIDEDKVEPDFNKIFQKKQNHNNHNNNNKKSKLRGRLASKAKIVQEE